MPSLCNISLLTSGQKRCKGFSSGLDGLLKVSKAFLILAKHLQLHKVAISIFPIFPEA